MIRVPAWVENPLGSYYMYFAHHQGSFIRLAYADDLHGPWTVHWPGSLKLHQTKPFTGHIASPDVHVDTGKKQFRMYFHGSVKYLSRDKIVNRSRQRTGVAFSTNGIDFAGNRKILGIYYFRVFKRGDYYYSIDRDGVIARSKDGVSRFEYSKNRLIPGMRHCVVMQKNDKLLVFYSRDGDKPERIKMVSVKMTDNWEEWISSEPIEVIRPETEYEGVNYPLKASGGGKATKVQELRDPAIFEEDGKIYLFYSIAGEMGIALAELVLEYR